MITYQLGKGTVLRLLRERGVEIRNQSLTPDQVGEAIQLYLRGWPLAKVGQHFHREHTVIRGRAGQGRHPTTGQPRQTAFSEGGAIDQWQQLVRGSGNRSSGPTPLSHNLGWWHPPLQGIDARLHPAGSRLVFRPGDLNFIRHHPSTAQAERKDFPT